MVSGQCLHLIIQVWQKRHLALQGRVSLETGWQATNPRTGGHRPKKRPLTTGVPVGHFLTRQASSSMPHWCPTWCRRTWCVGWWSTTASMSRCSRSWCSYAVACSVMLSFSVLRSFLVSPLPLRVVRSCPDVVVTSWLQRRPRTQSQFCGMSGTLKIWRRPLSGPGHLRSFRLCSRACGFQASCRLRLCLLHFPLR